MTHNNTLTLAPKTKCKAPASAADIYSLKASVKWKPFDYNSSSSSSSKN